MIDSKPLEKYYHTSLIPKLTLCTLGACSVNSNEFSLNLANISSDEFSPSREKTKGM